MTVGQSTTHDIVIGADKVTKRYRSWERDEPQREWTALTLLTEHAPDLAPAPLRAALHAHPPTLMMSRLPGHVLRGEHADDEQATALAAALTKLHQSIPTHVVEAVEPAAWGPAAAVAKVRTWADKQPDLGQDPDTRRAYQHGVAWLATSTPDQLSSDPLPPVLGLADGNHANYLWDEHDRVVRLIDWEDSGRSDKAFEIAEVLEHISRLDGALNTNQVIAALDLSGRERQRVEGFRRLLAFGWFLMLGPDGPFNGRNPPGTLERQTQRVLHLMQ
ncbi:phosphotransferase family protein [Nonomuraea sp. NPDC050790]|uniref:phosphotransferase family protein n=1 Tax=Nonomuraea sp. NPDC050790 TaxID=3364371 RepID=UPI003795EB27